MNKPDQMPDIESMARKVADRQEVVVSSMEWNPDVDQLKAWPYTLQITAGAHFVNVHFSREQIQDFNSIPGSKATVTYRLEEALAKPKRGESGVVP
jgi:hypothetical protein